jgi:rhodanese-related sulfurtransferase
VQTINTETVAGMQRRRDEVPVINVLSQEQFRQRHIPGSQNIPLTDPRFVEKVESAIAGRDAPVIVYSASEECDASQQAAAKLEAAGFSDVYDYAGGMRAWTESGRSVQGGTRSGRLP